ncbi:hypothetical protein KIPB_008191, partial [Kipferlia bialata]
HSTNIVPNINSTVDATAFFFGTVGRFIEVISGALGVVFTSLEGSFVQALILWQLVESGAVTLRPVEVDFHATDTDVVVGQKHEGFGVFTLPNIGPVLTATPSAGYFSEFGKDSVLGVEPCLFLSAFATVYTAYSFLAALQVDFSCDIFQVMKDITTQPNALAALRASHSSFTEVDAARISQCFPNELDPAAFEPLRFNTETCEMETFTLRDPVELEDFFMTHPRWTLAPVLTNTNRAFAHSIAACMTFGLPSIVNSSRTVGKTWAVMAAINLTPPFCQCTSAVAAANDHECIALSNNTARAADGSLVPLFHHSLAIHIDFESTDPEDLISNCTPFEVACSRCALVSDQSPIRLDRLVLGEGDSEWRRKSVLVEQDDSFSAQHHHVPVEGVTVLMETHMKLDSDTANDGNGHDAEKILRNYAFTFNCDQLIDYELVSTLFSTIPMPQGYPEKMREAMTQTLFNVADHFNLSPLRIIHSLRKLGLLATRRDPSLFYSTPVSMVAAALG